MTVQIQDYLEFAGEAAWIVCDMVIGDHPRIRKLNDKEAMASGWIVTSACHRNFLASWVIKDGKLYLMGIAGVYQLEGEALLFADWYSGKLHAQAGKMLKRPTFGYDSRRERDIEIEVNAGVVIRQCETPYDPLKPTFDDGMDVPPFIRRKNRSH